MAKNGQRPYPYKAKLKASLIVIRSAKGEKGFIKTKGLNSKKGLLIVKKTKKERI